MADTSVKIDDTTRDRLKALADSEHMSMKDYLAKVAAEKEHEKQLDTATAAFRRLMAPGVLDRFDADFGGLPPTTAHKTPRAA
ncbi:antitoxin MazE7 [Streptomyces sp. NBC_00038]|uniref:antitoxin MazE7 n=1 Tax=Streptomyces sp. NBC_00038 TaxID=2903615 RepID=UPI00225835EF|nr:antitoxin MazE7 [Streptomyces sp. NBC_00038]MCX5562807.1 antitoxin MazE7 [Streptomyces sp. NBC_00038]